MNILVVDDHVLIREALRAVLNGLRPHATVLEASNGHQAMQIAEEVPDLDLILLDLNLPDRDGFSLLTELRARYATTGIVVLSASKDRDKVKRALDLGVLGFIPKTTEREIMLTALQLVFSGGVYIPPEILAYEQSSPETSSIVQPPTHSARELLADLGLTGRQIEVLGLMMQGKSNKAISRELKMAEPTVKNHATAIFRALKVANRIEAVIKVGKMGGAPIAGQS